MGLKKAGPIAATAVATYFGGPQAGAAVYSQFRGAQVQQESLDIQAKAEQSSAKNREIDRKRNLLRALAIQNVKAGASGVTGGAGSSTQAMMQEDIRSASFDAVLDTGATSQRVSQLKQNAKNIAEYSLLSAAGEGYGLYRRTKKRGEL